MNTHGVVLAAGYGTRMLILSDCAVNRFAVAKPALPVGIRSQVRQQLCLMSLMGLKDVTVVTKYLPETVTNAIGDQSKFNLKIHTFDMNEHNVEDWGSAWTVYRWLSQLEEKPDAVIVLNGDILWDKNLTVPFIDVFKRSGSLAQIAAAETPVEKILGKFGLVQTVRGEGVRQVTGFIEKPSKAQYKPEMGNLANIGIFAIQSQVFNSFADQFGPGFADFARHLFQHGMLGRNMAFDAFVTGPDFYWKDIGTPLDLIQANFDVLAKRIDAGPQGKEIKPGVWIGDNTEIADSALSKIKPPVIIGDNVYIGKKVRLGPYVVVGNGWQIMPFAKISYSLLLTSYTQADNVRVIASNARLSNGILAGGTIDGCQPWKNFIAVISPEYTMAYHGYDFSEVSMVKE